MAGRGEVPQRYGDRNGTYGRAREVEALPDFGLARALLGRFFRHRFGLFSLPLSQLTAIDPDDSTDEAIGDWHY
ncbi:MAG: hypothetical protein DMG57_00065 [Acidobacteria bacterium]|nr:MAG: hypothetical protein DMG57_00065 [Acidobacteriota bacterium]